MTAQRHEEQKRERRRAEREAVSLDAWTCRILLSKDAYGAAVVGFGTTAERAERDAERLLKGRKGFKRSTVQCSGSKAGAL